MGQDVTDLSKRGQCAEAPYAAAAPVGAPPPPLWVPTGREASPVAVAWGPDSYDVPAPYSPSVAYPEYPMPDRHSGRPNRVYQTVREALRLLDLDAERYGTPAWNPLGVVLKKGDTVVLKPNLVRDFRESSDDTGECTVTHGAVIRALVDYAYIAVGKRGRVIVADAPQNDAAFHRLRRICGLDEIQGLYRSRLDVDVRVLDLRPERADKIDGVICGHVALPGDPGGYVKVNLGRASAFAEIPDLCDRLYGAEYDREEILRHHSGEVHEYLISGTVLQADCVICVPKLKTHKKVGLTVNLKNLVGINGNKNWLPHHREGTPSQGGDQFADDGVARKLEGALTASFKKLFPALGGMRRAIAGPVKALGKKVFGDTNKGAVRSGNWHGNDTAWRMVLDLNRILLYADARGNLHDKPQRRFFSVVDGIIGGEGNGPLDPTARPAGVILAGGNPLSVDLACARLMGFDWRKIPMLRRGFEQASFPLAGFEPHEIRLRSNDDRFARALAEIEGSVLAFEPHFGWKGHIEHRAAQDACAGDAENAGGREPRHAANAVA